MVPLCARRLARWSADLTYHFGPGPAKVRVQLEFNMGSGHRLRRHRQDAGLRAPRSVDHARQPPRRLGQRRRRPGERHGGAARGGAGDRRAGARRLAAEAYDRLRRLGRRGARADLGSTEWAETHAEELREKAVVYINTDGNSRGFLCAMGGSHTLERLMNQVAAEVTDPQTGLSASPTAPVLALALNGEPDEQKAPSTAKTSSSIPWARARTTPPSSSTSASLRSTSPSAARVTTASTIRPTTPSITTRRFMDPKLRVRRRPGQVAGRAVLRLAGAHVLPFDTLGGLVPKLETYLEELIELADKMREETERDRRRLEQGVYSRPPPTRPRPTCRPSPKSRCRTSTSRRSRTPWPS